MNPVELVVIGILLAALIILVVGGLLVFGLGGFLAVQFIRPKGGNGQPPPQTPNTTGQPDSPGVARVNGTLATKGQPDGAAIPPAPSDQAQTNVPAETVPTLYGDSPATAPIRVLAFAPDSRTIRARDSPPRSGTSRSEAPVSSACTSSPLNPNE